MCSYGKEERGVERRRGEEGKGRDEKKMKKV